MVNSINQLITASGPDLTGFSAAVNPHIFEVYVDPFIQELHFYNYGAVIPRLWTDREFLEYVTLNYDLIKLLYSDHTRVVSLPSYQEAVGVSVSPNILNNLPTYEEVSNLRLNVDRELIRKAMYLGNTADYISVNEFPERLLNLARNTKVRIASWAILNNISTETILASEDSILIKYPWDRVALKIFIKISQVDYGTLSNYRFYSINISRF